MKITIYDGSKEACESMDTEDWDSCMLTVYSGKPVEISTGDKELWMTLRPDDAPEQSYSVEIHPTTWYPSQKARQEESIKKGKRKLRVESILKRILRRR